MSVSCGIVGLPNVGKSTLFNALTSAGAEQGNYPFCTIEPNVAIVTVPDDNLEKIARYIATAKIIPAVVSVVDIAGLIEGASKGEGMGNKFLANIRETDAIMQVVRCFDNPNVVRDSAVDPVKDAEVVELELGLADLDTLQRAIERVSKKARSGDKDSIAEKAVFEEAVSVLEAGRLLSSKDWSKEQRAMLRPLCLMTAKPILYVANVAEDDLAGESDHAKRIAERAAVTGAEWLPVSCDMECELRAMEPDERVMFMEELGIERLGLERLIHSTYQLLGLQTYYTAGPKEIRAWTIHRGDTAPKAAGVIHTDFEKGFIRVECYQVEDLEAHGTEAAIKAAGKLRTEGRDYVMREGDVCHFLFSK